MATATQIRSYTYDSSLVLKAAGLVAADAAGSLIVNVGDATFKGVAVIDVTAIETASTDEQYRIVVQGSTSATFASSFAVCELRELVAVTMPSSRSSAPTSRARSALPPPSARNASSSARPFARESTPSLDRPSSLRAAASAASVTRA